MKTILKCLYRKGDNVLRIISRIEEAFLYIGEKDTATLHVTLSGRRRGSASNRKMWAMLNDVSRQVEWGGCYLANDDWKQIFSAAHKNQELVPGINGGFVALGAKTSELDEKEFSDLIEIIYAFGADKGVVWSEG